MQSLFRLLLSLERIGTDPLHLLDLVCAEKPLKALDFCYHGDTDTINTLDSIALAVMGASYAIDTYRGHQLLVRSFYVSCLFFGVHVMKLIFGLPFADDIGSDCASIFEALADQCRS